MFDIIKKLLLAIILLQSIRILAKRPQIEFKHLKVADGLSQSWVKSICQDQQGFMWFGTHDGLNKYDGYNFTVYKHSLKNKNSISDNSIESLHEDKNGNLWIGTENGLNLYDRNNDRFIHDDSWPQGKITCFLELGNGRFYIGSNTGLQLFDHKNDTTISFLHDEDDSLTLSNNYINSIVSDKKGNIWIGTLDGLNLLDTLKYRFKHFRKNNKGNSISNNEVRALHIDSKGRIWIGTREGLDLLTYKKGQPEKFKLVNYQHNPENQSSITNGAILTLMEDKSGNLWIGTEDGGLNIIDLNSLEKNEIVFNHYKHEENDNSSLSYNSIYSIYEDRTANIWVGTFGNGINIYNKSREKFIHYKQEQNDVNSLNNNFVNAILDEDDYLWIGTDGGLNLFDKKNKTFKYFVHNPNNSKSIGSNAVWAIKRDSRGNLWVGTWAGGLNLFNSKTNNFTRFKHNPNDDNSIGSNNVFAIIEDHDGELWIATMGGGLNLFDYNNRTFKRYMYDDRDEYSISDDWVNTVFESSYGEIWVATSFAIDLFDKEKGKFIHFTHDNSNNSSISTNGATLFFEDSKGNLWIGTRKGLDIFNRKDSTFSYYLEEDGLPNNQINGILEDEHGNLWISTNKGISEYINGINRLKNPVFKNYNVSDGLQGNEFNKRAFCKGKDGRMYFGGKNGFNVFHPDSIKENLNIPPLVITELLLFNRNIPIGEEKSPLKKHISVSKEITLSYKHSAITLRYVALNFLASEKNQYAYMLEGFEEEWNYVENKREATYTNLDPGTYTFRVKGSNNDGVWNEEGASLKIIITPPFWKTVFFRVFLIILIISMIYAIHFIRVQNIVEYGHELEIKVAERTKDLEDFAYIVSHDLKAPLRGINELSEWILEDYSNVLDKEGKENLNILRERTSKMNDMIQGILEYSRIGRIEEKAEKIDLNELAQDTIDLLAPPDNIKILIENELPEYTADRTRLTQLFENLLSNSIKYIDKPEGIIKIGCTEEENEWKFRISDNGPGIEEKYFEKIFKLFHTLEIDPEGRSTGIGLTIVKKIIALYGGKIWVESEIGKGTTFYFTLSK